VRTAYTCRAYPDQEQGRVLNRTFGCVRVAWNRTLEWRRHRYQAGTSLAQASAYLTAMKATDELTWLNAVSAVPLQQAIRHQQAAYTAFFAQRARYPRFKSRNGRQCAVSRDPCGRWYVSLAVHVPEPEPLPAAGRVAGVDLGITDFAVTSDGQRIVDRWYLSTKTCPSCGTRHDRDHACGADVSHSGSSRVRSAVKQEPRPVRAGIPVHQGGK
jgi:putative transposase